MLRLTGELITFVACGITLWFMLRRRPFNPEAVTAVLTALMLIALVLILLGADRTRDPGADAMAIGALVVAMAGDYILLRALATLYRRNQND